MAVAKATVDELLAVELICALLCAAHDHASTAILRVIAARMTTAGTTARLWVWHIGSVIGSVAVATCHRTVLEAA